MARQWTTDDLREWDGRIREMAAAFGLDWFPQEFEICDHQQMLGYMAYSGMPAHYPHWSYGKAYETQKTMYDYGVSGLPYEMVINSNPSIAYLMSENSLTLQVLTMAHVYGHNDFFKNNFTFRHTEPEKRLERVKSWANRVRSYIEDPSIGLDAVEEVLDAAHALQFQCRRNLAVRQLGRQEQIERAYERSKPRKDPFAAVHKTREHEMPDLDRFPLEPEEDLLLLIRDASPHMEEWRKDLLTIVHQEARYFIPQIETKIMNEGWATFWHHTMMNALDLPSDMHMEFLVRHNQVVRRIPGDINPYHVGFHMWKSLEKRFEEEEGSLEAAREKLFAIREVDRDVSFLRRFLDEKMMRDLDLFSYAPQGDKLVIENVSDADGWRDVKQILLANVGMAAMPVIRVYDVDYGGAHTLLLRHDYDGRDLKLDYAEATLRHLKTLWPRDVRLETVIEDEPVALIQSDAGFEIEKLGNNAVSAS